jgi:hypothetical protein
VLITVDSSFSKYNNERTIDSSYLKQIRIKEQCHFGYFKKTLKNKPMGFHERNGEERIKGFNMYIRIGSLTQFRTLRTHQPTPVKTLD